MVLVTVDALKNALTPDQKSLLIERITSVLAEIDGETGSPLNWVRINEFDGGDWAVGGRRLSAHDVVRMASANQPPLVDSGRRR